MTFPYEVGRLVIYPILRSANFGTVVRNFGNYLSALSDELFVNYLFNGNAFTQLPDLSGSNAAWIIFFNSWQQLFCFGCNDLCPLFTKLPVIPMFLTSDQLKDPYWLMFTNNFLFGWISFVQQILYLLQQIIFGTQQAPDFTQAFELWCISSTGFWRSWENILQEFWDYFLTYRFVWANVLDFMNTATCMVLQSFDLLLDCILNAFNITRFFNGSYFQFWNETVKHRWTAIINLGAPSDAFAPIYIPIVNTTQSVSISSYQLLTTWEATPWGLPNPIFGARTVSDGLCLTLKRVLCDPLNNGTTCAQQFNGTALANFDPCCFTNQTLVLASNLASGLFEFTLHFQSANQFIVATDAQPFTGIIANNIVNAFGCFFNIFTVVKNYGFCISRVLYELLNFIAQIAQLLFKVLVGLVTLPYFEVYLPGNCNYISCPGDSALNQTIMLLENITDPNNPSGFVNCLCFLLNSGLNVPYANCTQIPCVPQGYVPPPDVVKRHHLRRFTGEYSIYNVTSKRHYYAHRLTPILTYGNQTMPGFTMRSEDYFNAKDAFAFAATRMYSNMDKVMMRWTSQKSCNTELSTGCKHPNLAFRRLFKQDRWNPFADDAYESLGISTRATIQTPSPIPVLNCTDPNNPPPCFNLCCIFVKIITLIADIVAVGARILNALLNTRSGQSNPYFTGATCPASNCLQSDLMLLITDIFNIPECACEFIKLLIPPAGYADPCCAFAVAGELVSAVLQILVNVGNSVAYGGPQYEYITNPDYLVADFNIVLETILTLFDCVCSFISIIFSVVFTGITQTQKAFDLCCMPRCYVRAALYAVKMLFRLVLSLSTLQDMDSQCYIYIRGPPAQVRPNCAVAIAELPIMQDFYGITASLFAPPSEALMNKCAVTTPLQEQNPSIEGLPTCVCNTVNAVLAGVFKFFVVGFVHVGVIDDTTNPQCVINVCCWFYRLGQVTQLTINFIAQAIATLWQNWQSQEIFILGSGFETFYVPQATLDFLFCNEYNPASLQYGQLSLTFDSDILYNIPGASNVGPLISNACLPGNATCPNPSGLSGIINAAYLPGDPATMYRKCGKLEPAITALQHLLGSCMCSSSVGLSANASGQNYVNTCGINNPNANGIGNVLDQLLRWALAYITTTSQLFPFQLVWPECLCCGGPVGNPYPGILKPAAIFITVQIRAIILLIRNIPNPSYWSGEGVSLSAGSSNNPAIFALADNLADIRKTWIYRFLAPSASSVCIMVTNAGCLLSMVLGNTCEAARYNVISSWIAYYLQAIIRIIALIEGAIKLIAMELPGQCVGNQQANAGNVNQENSQGSTGNNKLIPTCSPGGGGVIAYAGNLNGNQIGRIAVSLLTFVADAWFGIGKLGCTQVCPGLPSSDPAVNLQSAGTCSCYQLTPYVGVGGSLCSFPTCQGVFNGGASGEFRCPDGNGSYSNATFCTAQLAAEPPNSNVANVFAGLTLRVSGYEYAVQTGHCIAGCSNASEIRQAGETWSPAGGATWYSLYGNQNYNFIPQYDASQPTGLRCEITNPSIVNDTVVINKAKSYFGENYLIQTPVPTFSLIFCNSNIPNPFIPPNSPNQRWRCIGSEAYVVNIFQVGQAQADAWCQWCVDRQTSPGFAATNGNYAPAYIQPVCTRDWCVSKGWCKNDQNVPCYPGGPVLDGTFIVSLKYLSCLLRNLFGGFMGVVFDVLLGVLSFLWQLSGGIIRFSVSIGVVVFNFLTRIPFVNFFLAIPDVLSLFGDFLSIFTQPVVFTFRGTSPNSMENANQDSFRAMIEKYFGFDDGHDCIFKDPVYCFCRVLSLHPVCSVLPGTRVAITPSGQPYVPSSLKEFFGLVVTHYAGSTTCDMIFQELSNKTINSWVDDVAYAQRVHAIQCLTLRSQGETWFADVQPDFFYNPNVFLHIYDRSVLSVKRFLQRDDMFHKEARKKRADAFASRFGIERDHFYRIINARGEELKRALEKDHYITEESPVLWPMMQLDMYWFKFRAGYYHYLIEQWGNFEGTSVFGSLSENIAEVKDALLEIKQSFHMLHVSEIQHHVSRLFQETLQWPKRGVPIRIEAPRWLTAAWDMRPWKNLGLSLFPSIPSIRYNFGEPFEIDWSFWDKIPTFSTPNPDMDRVNYNRESAERVLRSVTHQILPFYTTHETHRRFILNGNCTIADGIAALGTQFFAYCIAQQQMNSGNENGTFVRDMLPYYQKNYLNVMGDKIEWRADRFSGWKRPAMKRGNSFVDWLLRRNRETVDHRHYRRTVAQASGINGLIIGWINSIFGINLLQMLNEYFVDVQNWVSNTNIAWSDYPNVGLRFWALFQIQCRNPYNLNCGIGLGLGEALWLVGVIFLGVGVVLTLLFPALRNWLAFAFTLVIYFIVVAEVAWGYSPACLMLFPSIQYGDDMSLPILPIPLSIFPALPECLMDQVVQVLDSIFASCYSWIPECWLNQGPCLSCPDRLSFPDCNSEIQLINPLQITIYWGYRIFGNSFCSVMRGLSSNVVGMWIPGFDSTVAQTCINVNTNSPTQQCRQQLCGILGVLSLSFVFITLLALSTFIITMCVPLIDVFHGSLLLIPTLFGYDAAVGMGEENGVFVNDGENRQQEQPARITGFVARKIHKVITGKEKIE